MTNFLYSGSNLLNKKVNIVEIFLEFFLEFFQDVHTSETAVLHFSQENMNVSKNTMFTIFLKKLI